MNRIFEWPEVERVGEIGLPSGKRDLHLLTPSLMQDGRQ